MKVKVVITEIKEQEVPYKPQWQRRFDWPEDLKKSEFLSFEEEQLKQYAYFTPPGTELQKTEVKIYEQETDVEDIKAIIAAVNGFERITLTA